MLNELANELSAVLVEKDKSHILEGKDFSLEIHGVGMSKWNYPKFTEDAERVRVTCAPLSMPDGRELNAPNSLTYSVKRGPKAIANNVRKLLVPAATELKRKHAEAVAMQNKLNDAWKAFTSELAGCRSDNVSVELNDNKLRILVEKTSKRNQLFSVELNRAQEDCDVTLSANQLSVVANLVDAEPHNFQFTEIRSHSPYKLGFGRIQLSVVPKLWEIFAIENGLEIN